MGDAGADRSVLGRAGGRRVTRVSASPNHAGYLSVAHDDCANTLRALQAGQRARAASGAGTARDAVRPRSASTSLPAPSFFVPEPRALGVQAGRQREALPWRMFPRARGWERWERAFGTRFLNQISSLERCSQCSQVSRAHDVARVRAYARTLEPLFPLGTLGTYLLVSDIIEYSCSKTTFPRKIELGTLGTFRGGRSGSNKIGGGYAAALVQVPDQGLDRGEAGRNFRRGGGSIGAELGAAGRFGLVGGDERGNGGFQPFSGAAIGAVGMLPWECGAKGVVDQRLSLIDHELCRLTHRRPREGDRSIAQAEGGTPPNRASASTRSLAQPIFWISGPAPLSAGPAGLPTGAKFVRSGWGAGRGFSVSGVQGGGKARRRGGALVQGSGHGRLRSRQIGAERQRLWAGVAHVNA